MTARREVRYRASPVRLLRVTLMNRVQQVGAGIAVVAASAALLVFVAHASPAPSPPPKPVSKPDALSSTPPQTEAALVSICSTVVDDGRPDPLWLRQSFENDNCWAPNEPIAPDGTKASRAQIEAGMRAAKLFMVSADRYQKCISDHLGKERQEERRTRHPASATFVLVETHRLAASDQSKKRVQDAIALAVNDFNADGSGCPE